MGFVNIIARQSTHDFRKNIYILEKILARTTQANILCKGLKTIKKNKSEKLCEIFLK